ncbi:hypothetical protein MtrunA17_Chr3g0132781 [Medicago truncatula]|uniref:Transmembrane protein, putative n=1 Tax=Medicago truncatula TaxID=3880 RepID=G7J4K5_MEDTR|nr:transmembrane protein, putative [Medicago truncatula]RHN70180.1 hypothetical protein MtrunA17_Chr3g0132781 [Medicago truncatula]
MLLLSVMNALFSHLSSFTSFSTTTIVIALLKTRYGILTDSRRRHRCCRPRKRGRYPHPQPPVVVGQEKERREREREHLSEVNDNGDGGGDGGGSWSVRKRKEQGRKCECVFHIGDSRRIGRIEKKVFVKLSKYPAR